jgi:hypothetical protein
VATCTFQVNGPGSCTVTHTGSGPDDDDGVPDATEDGVNASGDGNGDGQPDSTQDNVSSVPSPVSGGGYVTVEAPAGSTLSSVTVADPASYPAPPAGATLDNGVIAYTVNGVTPGATVDVDVYLTTPTTASGYAKIQGGQWVALPGAAFTKVSNTHFVLHLTDGGVGDEDGQANGTIVDPGAPLDLDHTPPTISCPTGVVVLLHAPNGSLTATVSDGGSGVAAAGIGGAKPMTVCGMNGRLRSDTASDSDAAKPLGAALRARIGSASPAMFGLAISAASSELASGSPPLPGPRPNSWSRELGCAAGRSEMSAAGAAPPMSSPRAFGGADAFLMCTESGAKGSQSDGIPAAAAAAVGAPAGDAGGAADGARYGAASGSISTVPEATGAAGAGPSSSAKGSAAVALPVVAPAFTDNS